MDPKALQMACMADLGRLRQDELPLSRKETKGPSYAPMGRNGTSHYSKNMKDGLESKWGEQIKDEESEQVDGLANQDSRPWAAKITRDYLARHQTETAPPKVAQQHRGQKRGTNAQTLQTAAKSGSSKKNKPIKPPPGFSSIIPANSPDLLKPGNFLSVAEKGLKDKGGAKAPLSNTQTEAARATKTGTFQPQKEPQPVAKPVKPANPRDEEPPTQQSAVVSTPALPQAYNNPANKYHQVVHNGDCELLKQEKGAKAFRAKFQLSIRLDINTGYLSLYAPDKGEKVHDVLDLMRPVLTNDYCAISSNKAKAGADYWVRLPNPAEASKFCLYLESLQRAAARGKDGRHPELRAAQSAAHGATNTAATASESITKPPNASGAPSSQAPKEEKATPVAKGGVHTSPAKTSAGDTQTAHTGDESITLVDITECSGDPTAGKKGGVETSTIEDAAEELHKLVQRILPEALAQGVQLSDATMADMENTAIDSWLSRGFLESETDDMKTELLDLLRILVRIKRKAEARAQRPKPSPAPAPAPAPISSLKGFETGDKPATRIKYSTAEITTLSKNATPNSPYMDGATTPRRAPKTEISASVAVSNVSKHRGWLYETPKKDSTSPKPDQSHATRPDAAFTTLAKPPISAPPGLGISRWSDSVRSVSSPAVSNLSIRPPPGLSQLPGKTSTTRSASSGLAASRWAHN